MSRSKHKRVFILGAGCSAAYGYPLGAAVRDELNGFLANIPESCLRIRGAVKNSVDLGACFPQADTLDKLVNLIEERFRAFRATRGSIWQNADTKEESLTDQQILDAKIATTALFLEREPAARTTALAGYRERLLPDIFGTTQDWQSAVSNSDCSVLTFNYDRLFEITFLDRFRDFNPNQFPFYGTNVLNSGFDPTLDWGRKRVEIAPDRFCFLKLHGSAGWRARNCPRPPNEKLRDYCPLAPSLPLSLLELENLLAQNNRIQPWEPLIAFPHEKQRFTSRDPGDFVQGPYIGKVWKHAATVLQEATEVTVIGYSFAEIDREHVVKNLLGHAPTATRIRIEDKNPEAVQRALQGFEVLHGRLDVINSEF